MPDVCTPPRRFKRLLLTGAAGGLGSVLREQLQPYADIMRLSDISAMPPARSPKEEIVPCDLADRKAVLELARDCDAIVHFGGVSVERPFEEILPANICGVFHIYEAARQHGIRRIVFASSNHVIGFYKQGQTIDARSPRRPDSYYGLSKSYGEDMASFYFDRYGIETVSIRIGSSFPEARDRRMLATWLSYRDLTTLIGKALFTPDVGHTVVYGASNNPVQWWDNRYAAHLDFQPEDTSAIFQEKIAQQPMPPADDPSMVYQGGAFTVAGPFDAAPRASRRLPAAELVLDARNATGESPVWSSAEQALYWVDIPAGRLHRWHAPTTEHSHWQADQDLSCIARSPDGTWIAGMRDCIARLQTRDDGRLHALKQLPVDHAQPGMRFNDGRCDRQGRFWAGTMVSDMSLDRAAGRLYRLDSDDTQPHPVLDGLVVPNGLAFSPDGKTMYLSDSHPSVQKIWTFDYDPETGTPSGRRLFVDMTRFPGRPDGAAIDEDGCYWICGNDAGLIHRFTPDGQLDRSIAVPVAKPAMCAFGGPGMETLFVVSIRPANDHDPQSLAGGVFAVHPGVKGIAEPLFLG